MRRHWLWNLTLAGAAAAAVGGCEKHGAPAAGAPEYLHDALSGDIRAQAMLADCYGSDSRCLMGLGHDPALACAWRGVRLASRRPELSLADETLFRSSCALTDPTQAQRAAIGFADLVSRVYPGAATDLAQATAPASRAALYPSMAAVRARVNLALAQNKLGDQLPAFGPPAPGQAGDLGWSACSASVCLEGATPAFGGGVLGYRVEVLGTAPGRAAAAASLAAAGLEAPSAAKLLAAAGAGGARQGPVCWTAGQDARGAFAAASPCGAHAGGKG